MKMISRLIHSKCQVPTFFLWFLFNCSLWLTKQVLLGISPGDEIVIPIIGAFCVWLFFAIEKENKSG